MTTDPTPRLLLIPSRPLSQASVLNLRSSLSEAFSQHRPHRLTVLPSGLEVYQFVGGRWVPLRSDAPGLAADADLAGGVTTPGEVRAHQLRSDLGDAARG